MDLKYQAPEIAVSDALFFDKLKWLTSKEAAFLLRTSAGQVRNLVWRGRLKAFHFGSRLRFLRSDVEGLVKAITEQVLAAMGK